MKDQDQHPEIVALAMAQGITLDPCLLRDYPVGTWFWAVHHQVICEPLTEPLINRIRYILTDKDATERPTRLRALRPMKSPDDLPSALLMARDKLGQARDKLGQARAEYEQALAMYCRALAKREQALAGCDQARAEYEQAWAKYEQARAKYEQQLLAQWDREYPDHPKWEQYGLVF
jgi:hypothetical protein